MVTLLTVLPSPSHQDRPPPGRRPVLHGNRLRASRRTALPRRRPGCGGAWLQSSDDIDHDRSVGRDRLLEGRGDRARLLDADAAHAEAAGDLGKIGRPEADQFLAAVPTIPRNPVYAGQVLAEAGIVVDDDHDRDVAATRRLQLGEVIVEAAIAGKTEHRAVPGGALRTEGRRKGPAERAGCA